MDNEQVSKKMQDVIEQLVLKEKSNEELRIEMRNKVILIVSTVDTDNYHD